MDYMTAIEVWRQMQGTALVELREDLVDSAVRYARLRVDYQLSNADRRQAIEEDRRTCHNGLIAACDILARNMGQRGEDKTWRERLGSDRKSIGDFACFLHAILGVAAR